MRGEVKGTRGLQEGREEVMQTLETLTFDNSYARLPEAFYARVSPTALERPFLVSFDPDAAVLIDLDPNEGKRQEFVATLNGERPFPGADPVAMAYAGHQFGRYVPQLGDGRALLLGEVTNGRGERWDLHLKGAGQTPFSRDDDGRAVLRSTVREYLCSEAMHGLGIPTTRALCVIGSEEPVFRESVETGALLLRLAPTHVRFGTFELFYYRQQHDYVQQLADYVIARHFPWLREAEDRYLRLLDEVAARTAQLLAGWQAVGFAHGVMNSDNMSILGITLDYGPFGFMDTYQAAWVCNHSDRRGRYAFENQPDIGYFNLRCLAQALSPLIPTSEVPGILEAYEQTYRSSYGARMREKLGLHEAHEGDAELVGSLLQLFEANQVDYPSFFRALSGFSTRDRVTESPLQSWFADREAFHTWAARYRRRLHAEQSLDSDRASRMDRVNPAYVLRNYLAQSAITKAAQERDYTEIERLRELLRDPFTERPGMEAYAAPPPEWGRQLVLSCSS